MYDEAGEVGAGLLADLEAVLPSAFGGWTHYNDGEKDYWTWFPKKHCPELPFEDWRDPFFLKLKPGGKVHRHRDNEKPYVTYHIPVMSNDKCICYSEEDNQTLAKHLDVGTLYTAIRTHPHWSSNEGETDRIHLLVPVYGN